MDKSQPLNDEVVRIGIDVIDEPPHAMRTDMDRDALQELADDIKKNGLISPITVRPVGARYEVVAGHRRLLACGLARLFVIPCVVRTLTDEQVFSIMTSENLKRNDVDPVDEGIHFRNAMQKHNYTIPQLASEIGRSPKYVDDRLTIANMPEYMQMHLKNNAIKMGVALSLNRLQPDELRKRWVALAVQDNITIRTADYWVYQWELGTLPDVLAEGEVAPDAPPGERHIVKFNCSVDGKAYPAGATTMITISLENLPIFDAFVNEFRRLKAEERSSVVLEPEGVGV
jgi:ParB/RepB/Spo0J family partition protein